MSLIANWLKDHTIPAPQSPCLLWTGCTNPKGYGKTYWHGRYLYAHRLAWLIYRGVIPPGMCVMHKCDTPTCVRPGHLRLGTIAENNRDMDRKGRHGKGGSRIRQQDANDIRTLVRKHMVPIKLVARYYGMTDSNVRLIASGKRVWKGRKGCH